MPYCWLPDGKQFRGRLRENVFALQASELALSDALMRKAVDYLRLRNDCGAGARPKQEPRILRMWETLVDIETAVAKACGMEVPPQEAPLKRARISGELASSSAD